MRSIKATYEMKQGQLEHDKDYFFQRSVGKPTRWAKGAKNCGRDICTISKVVCLLRFMSLFTITIILRVFSLCGVAIGFARIPVRNVTLILMFLHWCTSYLSIYFMFISFNYKYTMLMFIIPIYLPVIWYNLWHYRW